MPASVRAGLDDPNNSFAAVRLICALAVVVTHSSDLVTGSTASGPLAWAAYNLGQIAVNTFFFLSGLMLARSFELRPDVVRFTRARLLRVLPALFVASLVTAFVIAPLATHHTFSGYFETLETWLYPLATAVFFESATLPEVFGASSWPGVVNVSLWTVKYELLAYAAFAVAAILGMLRSKAWPLFLLVGLALALSLLEFSGEDKSPLGSILRFGFCFLLGVAAYSFSDKIVPRWIPLVGLFALWLALDATIAGRVVSILAFSYLALFLGARKLGVVTKASNESDLSYGIYLYAWPVQQALLPFVETTGLGLVFHTVAAAAIAGCFAMVSWRFVEKPALSLKQWPSHRAMREAKAAKAETA